MPYVLQERRPHLDPVVEKMAKAELTMQDVTDFLIALRGDVPSISEVKFSKYMTALKEAQFAEAFPNGDINYILFKYCKYHIKPSYNNYKSFIGAIHRAKNEIQLNGYLSMRFIDEYRESAEWIRIKLLTPYEEEKIEENGDV